MFSKVPDVLVPVLTVFAGPNGSGKSTIQRQMVDEGIQLGPFVNADEIAVTLRAADRAAGLVRANEDVERDAFWMAQDRREELLTGGESFCLETVFSHIGKVEFLARARSLGYEVRLYFVSTENSRINVARVGLRVRKGGHDVPVEKIIARYRRAMEHIVLAFEHADQIVLFDNSGEQMRPVIGFERSRDGRPYIEIRRPLPDWISEVLRQLPPVITKLIASGQAGNRE